MGFQFIPCFALNSTYIPVLRNAETGTQGKP